MGEGERGRARSRLKVTGSGVTKIQRMVPSDGESSEYCRKSPASLCFHLPSRNQHHPHLFEALQLRSVTFPWKAHLSLGFCLHVVFIDVLCREAADDMSHPKLPVVRLPPYSNPRHQLHYGRHQRRFLFSSGTLL